MNRAPELVKSSMQSIDPQKKYPVWSFLNQVLMGIVPHAELDSVQSNLLKSTIQEVACDMHTDVLKDEQRLQQWAMQIATWVNGAHVANRT